MAEQHHHYHFYNGYPHQNPPMSYPTAKRSWVFNPSLAPVYPSYPHYHTVPGAYYQYTPTPAPATPPPAADDGDKEHVWHYFPAGEQSSIMDGLNNDGRVHHTWHGRTTDQVKIENVHMSKTAVVDDHAIAPCDPKPDSLFWVVDEDGRRMLLDINTINAAMQPGKWIQDGKTMTFIRTK